MRDKIVFFILGVIITSISFYAGKSSELNAQKDITNYDKLRVKELIVDNNIFAKNITAEKTIILADNDAKKVFGILLENSKIKMWLTNNNNIIDMTVAPDEAAIRMVNSIHGDRNQSIMIFQVSDKHNANIYLKDSTATKLISSHDVNVE